MLRIDSLNITTKPHSIDRPFYQLSVAGNLKQNTHKNAEIESLYHFFIFEKILHKLLQNFNKTTEKIIIYNGSFKACLTLRELAGYLEKSFSNFYCHLTKIQQNNNYFVVTRIEKLWKT